MAKNTTTRLPRVRRFEYLLVYLESINQGLGERQIGLKLAEKKKQFEIRKMQAIARGRTFSKKLEVTKALYLDCQKLVSSLEYTTIENNHASITSAGCRFLEMSEGDRKKDFCKRYLETYELAENFLNLIVAHPETDYVLPMKRDNPEFKEIAKKQDINLDQTNFEILRDMFTLFGFVNWFPFILEGAKLLKMYSTNYVCISREGNANQTEITTFYGKRYCSNSVDRNVFRKAIWQEYLGLTEYLPRRSALYSDLRDRTCYKLHIIDEVFDENVKAMLEEDSELIIVGSEGGIPFSHSLFAFLKRMPPEIDNKIIVYLKMDRREND